MTRPTLVSSNLCTGLIVLAVSAMSCVLIYTGVQVLMLLRYSQCKTNDIFLADAITYETALNSARTSEA